jgi:DNA-binding transcriptional LysR family regulator
VNIRQLDLNLLKVFDAIAVEGSVTGAAKRLGLSQSAVSNALARLRRHVQDDLFTSTGRGVTPTGKAREIAPVVRQALNLLGDRLYARDFDPAACEETFQIAFGEYTAHLATSTLLARLRREAPRASLRLLPIIREDLHALLARGDVVAAVVFGPQTDANIRADRLAVDHYVVAGRPGHRLLRAKADLDRYCAAPHVAISLNGREPEAVDAALARVGRRRRIVCVVNHLSLGGKVVMQSDALITATRRYLELFAPELEIARWTLPVSVRPFELSVISRPDVASSQAERWFLALVHDELRSLYAAANGGATRASGH